MDVYWHLLVGSEYTPSESKSSLEHVNVNCNIIMGRLLIEKIWSTGIWAPKDIVMFFTIKDITIDTNDHIKFL